MPSSRAISRIGWYTEADGHPQRASSIPNSEPFDRRQHTYWSTRCLPTKSLFLLVLTSAAACATGREQLVQSQLGRRQCKHIGNLRRADGTRGRRHPRPTMRRRRTVPVLQHRLHRSPRMHRLRGGLGRWRHDHVFRRLLESTQQRDGGPLRDQPDADRCLSRQLQGHHAAGPLRSLRDGGGHRRQLLLDVRLQRDRRAQDAPTTFASSSRGRSVRSCGPSSQHEDDRECVDARKQRECAVRSPAAPYRQSNRLQRPSECHPRRANSTIARC